MTIGFGFVMAGSEKEAIKREWAERRCEPYVVMTAASYAPDSYEGSSLNFASENFNYCMGKYAKGAINTTMSPVFASFLGVMDLGGVVSKIFNSLRQTIGELFRRFTSIFGIFFNTYNRFTLQASRITQMLRSSFLKINAVFTTAIYMAISMVTLGINTFKLAIAVTQIIVGILMGMSFILIFFMGPVGATLLAMAIAAGAAVEIAISLATEDTYQDYCFTAETPIKMADGTTKPVSTLKAGDELAVDCGHVRGVLHVDGSRVKLFSYKGIRVSGEHLVLHEGKWMRVEDCPIAQRIQDTVDIIYCPVTNTQRLPVQAADGVIRIFADWEEMDGDEMHVWQKAAADILNVPHNEPFANTEMGELGEDVYVYKIRGGWTPIKNIKINDMINYLDIGGSSAPTRVIGIYKGDSYTLETPASVGYGIWREDNDRNWYKPSQPRNLNDTSGQSAYNLITESGSFMIMVPGRVYNIRDFTEVGHYNLARITPDVVSQLNARL